MALRVRRSQDEPIVESIKRQLFRNQTLQGRIALFQRSAIGQHLPITTGNRDRLVVHKQPDGIALLAQNPRRGGASAVIASHREHPLLPKLLRRPSVMALQIEMVEDLGHYVSHGIARTADPALLSLFLFHQHPELRFVTHLHQRRRTVPPRRFRRADIAGRQQHGGGAERHEEDFVHA